jgi:hypothetical protein
MEPMKHLNSLEISGFRTFRHFRIENLSNVNLIVGANNLGKTSLLEALNLFFSQGNRNRITNLLLAREEFAFKRMRLRDFRPRDINLAYESLFYGRPNLESEPEFKIGPALDNNSTLRVSFSWLQELQEEIEGSVRFRTVKVLQPDELQDSLPGLEINYDDKQALVSLNRLDRDVYLRSRTTREPELPLMYLSSVGLSRDEVGRLWDTVALTEDEQAVITALKSISPSIEKVVLVQNPNERTGRTLMVKLEEYSDPVPFKSLGEGIEHLLNISLALIRARGGVLLIDEVENGIHYSVQPALWSIIFQQAANWNIQVFATTHSWDCVEGFQIAASSQLLTTGSLFRLEQAGKDVRAVKFAPREIEVARRESIEVR